MAEEGYNKIYDSLVQQEHTVYHKFETPTFEHEIFTEDSHWLLLGTANGVGVFWDSMTGCCFSIKGNKRLPFYDLKKEKVDYRKIDLQNRFATGDYLAVVQVKRIGSWSLINSVMPSFDSAYKWKLIHKKDTDILLAYLGATGYPQPALIQYKGNNADWTCLETDFIEHYEESTTYRLGSK